MKRRTVSEGIFTAHYSRHTQKAATRRNILRAVLLLLLPAALFLQFIAARNEQAVEHFYSRGVYRAISGTVSGYFFLFPFSCAEFLLYATLIFGVFLAVLAVLHIFRRRWKSLLRLLITVGCIFTTGYFLFTVMWGLNYCREPIAKNLGYKSVTPTSTDLSAVMKDEVQSINALCGKISYNKSGHSYYSGGFSKISEKVNTGYSALAKQSALNNILFGGAGARPKGIYVSKLMSYTGIEGIFVPFTYEPNVDTDLPPFVQPFDAAHESAHFKGFAREQEANFVAYLADTASSDPYFQYSAHMEAYIYVSDALYSTDIAIWKRIALQLDRRAIGDLSYYNNYIIAHQSKATDISTKINDTYLKSQGQRGVITYDLFVTLLLQLHQLHWRQVAPLAGSMSR